VLEWNAIMDTAVRTGTPNPIITTRVIALVNAAMFDAVNGIEQRYSPIHVNEDGPSRGSERAAAIQAAYAMLSKVYQLHPTLPAMLTTRRNESIAALATGHNAERPKAIEAGVAWGQHVADAIWDWRQNDGFNPQPPPAFWGADVVGTWRRTPGATGALANGFGTEFASMTPWVLARPSQFRAIPPHALSSPEYAADYNEVKLWGGATGSLRSADQSELVLFWNGNGPLIWNRLAARLSAERHMSMVSRARLFARLALAMADAAIACWDSKYRYVYWRPMTAIANGDSDGNDGTAGDASWQTWLAVTPAHPEYLSGHSTISGAAAHVLAAAFGENTQFWVDSDLRPGQRFFNSFSARSKAGRCFGMPSSAEGR
jgi:hypothetical protein